jgi:hypothetical protein
MPDSLSGPGDRAGFGGVPIVQIRKSTIPIKEVKERPGWCATERCEDIRNLFFMHLASPAQSCLAW